MFTEYTNWYLRDILFKATELLMEHFVNLNHAFDYAQSVL